MAIEGTIDARHGKQRWLIASAAAAVLSAVVVSMFQSPSAALSGAAGGGRPVELRRVTPERGTLSEETVMRDLTPLFLPTERNASLRKLPAREPGRTFLEVEAPKLGIAGAGWRFDQALAPVITLDGVALRAATPLTYLNAAAPDAAARGFGRKDVEIAPLAPRAGWIEVVESRSGGVVMAEAVPATAGLPSGKVWQPVEFLAAVGPAGLVAPLTLTSRSGVDEVDTFYRNYLARTFRVGERLPPGFYRITVAP